MKLTVPTRVVLAATAFLSFVDAGFAVFFGVQGSFFVGAVSISGSLFLVVLGIFAAYFALRDPAYWRFDFALALDLAAKIQGGGP